MSEKQDRFGNTARQARSLESDDGISWPRLSDRSGERLREASDATFMSVAERLEYAMSLVPAHAWQERIGRSQKQVKRYLGGADIPLSVLTAISAASGLPIDWLVSGRATEGAVADRISVAPKPYLSESAGGRPPPFHASLVRFQPADDPCDDPLRDGDPRIAIPSLLLRALHIEAADALVVEASGPYMSPTIDDGDIVIIDTTTHGSDRIRDGVIYYYLSSGRCIISRLARAAGSVIASWDNLSLRPSEGVVDLSKGFTIIGRVRWVGGPI